MYLLLVHKLGYSYTKYVSKLGHIVCFCIVYPFIYSIAFDNMMEIMSTLCTKIITGAKSFVLHKNRRKGMQCRQHKNTLLSSQRNFREKILGTTYPLHAQQVKMESHFFVQWIIITNNDSVIYVYSIIELLKLIFFM